MRIEVTPTGRVACSIGETVQFTATGYDSQGRAIPGVAVAWQSSDARTVAVSATGLASALAEGRADITAAAGSIVSGAVTVTVGARPSQQIVIPFKPSKGQLRQEVATRLAQVEGAKVTSARFRVYQPEQETDLSNVAAGLRGGFSGRGVLAFEITLGKSGEMTKAQVEQLCEQLPDFRNAQYEARLEIVTPRPQE